MLNEISLTNFKAIQTLKGMEIKPITIICGANSCGKSSIMQSLLLMKQTFESKSSTNTLLMNGKYVRLGNLENVIFSHNLKSKLRLSVSFDISPGTLGRFRIENRAPLMYLLRDIVPPLQDKRLLGYTFKLDMELSPAPQRRKTLITRPTNVDHFEVSITPNYVNAIDVPATVLRIEKKTKQIYEISYENVRNRFQPQKDESPRSGHTKTTVKFINLLPLIIQNGERADVTSTIFVQRINMIIQTIFGSFSYIGPLREEPARRYIYEDEIMEIGSKGENAPYILLTQKNYPIKEFNYYNYETNRFENLEDQTLSSALDIWLRSMKIEGFQVESSREMIHVTMNTNSSDRTNVSIADVGFGVSQIFPILLEGLRLDRGATLLLEQPEIHLHPKLQMYLSDYLISLALSGKGAIVETHSDHLINRLVRRIVENSSLKLENLIQIYFVTATNDGAALEKVNIDPLTGIVNWPDEFFDQSALELEAILRAGLNRRRENRSQ